MNTDNTKTINPKQKQQNLSLFESPSLAYSNDNSSYNIPLTPPSKNSQEDSLFSHRGFSSPKVVKAAHNIIESPVCIRKLSFDRKEPRIVILNKRPISSNLLLDSPRNTGETEI
ncbi:unnamed protein product [Blepharisma stoltei]|uniref:Uncharacterized protein n=1 Tax=Blepharisma stoltei TaxID=1481888 RepID=A0AAU9J2H4_9CILI|nr:unnamed protein product [Blepharisma stoltei]